VEEWVSLQLTESVMGVLSLQGSPEWSDASTIDSALCSEALTAAVMPRYATYSLIKRQLGSMVGASIKS
jgi:membrane glycosyltransferase